eukprot:758949-Hanusia_phi.AAC.3
MNIKKIAAKRKGKVDTPAPPAALISCSLPSPPLPSPSSSSSLHVSQLLPQDGIPDAVALPIEESASPAVTANLAEYRM